MLACNASGRRPPRDAGRRRTGRRGLGRPGGGRRGRRAAFGLRHRARRDPGRGRAARGRCGLSFRRRVVGPDRAPRRAAVELGARGRRRDVRGRQRGSLSCAGWGRGPSRPSRRGSTRRSGASSRSARRDVWVVGGDAAASGDAPPAPVLLHFDGTAFAPVALPPVDRTFRALFKVWAADATHVWAVGQSGVVLAFDGRAWTQVLAGTDQDLISLWGTGPTQVAAVGGRSPRRPLALRRRGLAHRGPGRRRARHARPRPERRLPGPGRHDLGRR
jgi:hypothetical protein